MRRVQGLGFGAVAGKEEGVGEGGVDYVICLVGFEGCEGRGFGGADGGVGGAEG